MKKFKRKNKTIIPTKKLNENIPPKNPDTQDIPQSLKEFIKLKSLVVDDNSLGKKKSKTSTISSKTTNCINETCGEKKQNNTVKKDETRLQKKRKNKFLKLREKQKLRKMRVKEKRDEKIEDLQGLVKDNIKFGEVVHRPPQISVLPRKVTKTGFENRPGRKDDLLLKSLLKHPHTNHEIFKSRTNQKTKLMNVSDQRQIELEKRKVMLAYQNMKMKNKNKT